MEEERRGREGGKTRTEKNGKGGRIKKKEVKVRKQRQDKKGRGRMRGLGEGKGRGWREWLRREGGERLRGGRWGGSGTRLSPPSACIF